MGSTQSVDNSKSVVCSLCARKIVQSDTNNFISCAKCFYTICDRCGIKNPEKIENKFDQCNYCDKMMCIDHLLLGTESKGLRCQECDRDVFGQ